LKTKSFFLIAFVLLFLTPGKLFAQDDFSSIRLKTDFNIWKINLDRVDWVKDTPKTMWNGLPVELPRYLPDDLSASADAYLAYETIKRIDPDEVAAYLEKYVAPDIHREKQDVTIGLDEDGKIVFDGFAFSGQEIDYKKTAHLINEAYLQKQEDVRLPIETIPPTVTVQSQELIDKGITGLIATGETDYSGSPYNRRNNIRVGLNRYNGWLIEPDEQASVIKRLGAVNEYTGYLPELVIKGDKTIPEYGGGLCQVSTTLYRSVLFSGMPVNERKNHSYAVSYYDPQGLDATIYIPNPDLKFTNDTGHHVLFQTTMIGDKAYSNIYGTKMDRHVDLIGPWYYSYRSAPAAKVEYTDQLAPGEKNIISGSHAGFDASWYRRISYAEEGVEDTLEHIYSKYEARGLITLIGNTAPPAPSMPSDNGT